MIGGRDIDQWVEFVLAGLLARDACVQALTRDLVADMAARNPEAPALSSVLPLSLAAATIEEMLAEPKARRLAELTWRMAALLAAEILAVQASAHGHETGGPVACADLAQLQARLRAEPDALGGVPGRAA